MPTSDVTNEFRLLVASSWIPPEEHRAAQQEKIEALCGSGLNWDSFLALVQRHQVAALVERALTNGTGSKAPEAMLGKLRQWAARAKTKSLVAAAECARIARASAAERIEVLPLKGGPLSAALFGDPALRHSTDVDIMVREQEVERFEAVLTSLGYQPKFPLGRTTPRLRAMLRSCSYACAYWNPRLQIAVDLHWDQDLWTRAQVGEIWRRSEQRRCLGAPMRLLEGDLLLLYLCDHGAKHVWSRIKWLSDVAMLLAQPRQRPWEELFELARLLDAAGALAAAALLVHSLYGVELPAALSGYAGRERRAPALAAGARVAMSLTQAELLTASRSPWVHQKLRSQFLRRPALPLTEHLRKRWIHADDLGRFALPDSLLWLHYPLRPFFWLWKQHRRQPAGSHAG